jgi:hypothetical protein
MGTLFVVLFWILLYTFLAFAWSAYMTARHKREIKVLKEKHEKEGWSRYTFREPDNTPPEMHGAGFPISILILFVIMPIGRMVYKGYIKMVEFFENPTINIKKPNGFKIKIGD